MRLLMACVFLYSIYSTLLYIQACRKTNKKVGKPKNDPTVPKYFHDWKVAPENDNWAEFENLLDYRNLTGQIPTSDDEGDSNSLEDIPDFPWNDLTEEGKKVFKPPTDAFMKNYHGAPPGPCTDPPIAGTGKGWFMRYYYNSSRNTCDRFIYTGYGGNANRYITSWHCFEKCTRQLKLNCRPEALFDFKKYLLTKEPVYPTR